MVGTKDIAMSGVGVGAGVGTTVLMRQQFDQNGETTILRPSVLWGLGTGTAALAIPALLGMRMNGAMGELVEDYGESALAAGAFSAFNPKGAGVQVPTL